MHTTTRHPMQSRKRKHTEEEKKSQPSSDMDVTSKAAIGIPHPPLVTDPKVANPARIMGSFLEKKQIPKVLSTSRGVRTLFSKALTPILLQACVNGERDKVNAILTQFPELLLEKGTVMDYSGRVHRNRTVYQLALGACDKNVLDKNGNIVVEGMVEMIEEHFKRLTMPEGFVTHMMKLIEDEETAGKLSKDQAKQEKENLMENPQVYYVNKVMRDQYEGQFPPEHEAKEEERVKQDRDADDKFMKVIEATSDAHVTITSDLDDKIYRIIRTPKSKLSDELRRLVSKVMKAPSNEFDNEFEALKRFLIAQDGFIKKGEVFDFELFKGLYQFRNHLEPKEEQTFGKHCNHQLLAEISQSYDDNYERFGNRWYSPKNKFCWQKRFGWAERGAPACDAQVIAQGSWSILENGEKSRRSLKFTYGDGSYYPLAADPNWEIGYNCAAAELWGEGVARFAHGGRRVDAVAFQNLCRAKISAPVLTQQAYSQPQKKNHCVVS
jgi:hypothetical protein